MASAVTSKCFPTPNRCDNCDRKLCSLYTTDKKVDDKREISRDKGVKGNGTKKMDSKTKPKNDIEKEKSGDRKVFKRCTGCFLMTYCEKTCQKEHWIRVHKYHCAHLSGKKVSNEHQENSCEECIANETASKDELFDINSPKIGCRIKEESRRMRRELGVVFGFHGEGYSCNCGNQFACEHPFPIGKIHGSAIATGLDEMIVHAAKLSNAFIIKAMKANEKKDVTDRLFVLHKNILRCRVMLWRQIVVYGDITAMHLITDLLIDPGRDVTEKVDVENPWWKSLDFTLACILKMALSTGFIQLAESEIKDTKLTEKYDDRQKTVTIVSMINKNNLWHRFKLWPSEMDNFLVLRLQKYVFCYSCNADLSGQVVGLVNAWDPRKLSPSLFGGVANTGGVVATCSPSQNLRCGEGYCDKINALQVTDEDNQKLHTLFGKTRVCHMCLKLSSCSHRCTECLTAQYCSKDCQEEDWKVFHKTVCSTWAEDPVRRLMSSKKQKEVTKKMVKISDKTW